MFRFSYASLSMTEEGRKIEKIHLTANKTYSLIYTKQNIEYSSQKTAENSGNKKFLVHYALLQFAFILLSTYTLCTYIFVSSIIYRKSFIF